MHASSSSAVPAPSSTGAASSLTQTIRNLVALELAASAQCSLRSVLIALADQLGEWVLEPSERRKVSELLTQAVRDSPRPKYAKSLELGRDGLSSGLTALQSDLHPHPFSFLARFDSSADGERMDREFPQFHRMLYEPPAGVHAQVWQQQLEKRRTRSGRPITSSSSNSKKRKVSFQQPSIQETSPLLSNSSLTAAASGRRASSFSDAVDEASSAIALGSAASAATGAEDGAGGEEASGINRPIPMSDDLAAFLCMPAGSRITRPVCIRALCEYVKQHDLQDPSDRRAILCDAPMRALFGGEERVTYFTLGKFLAPHLEKQKRVYKRRSKGEKSDVVPAPAGSSLAGPMPLPPPEPSSSAPSKPKADIMRLSPRLTEFFQHQTTVLPQGEIIEYLSLPSVERLINQYVHDHGILDAQDPEIVHIQPVPALQLLLGVEPHQLLQPGQPDMVRLSMLHSSIRQHLTPIPPTPGPNKLSRRSSLQADHGASTFSQSTWDFMKDELARAQHAAQRTERRLEQVRRHIEATFNHQRSSSSAAVQPVQQVTDLTEDDEPAVKRLKTKALAVPPQVIAPDAPPPSSVPQRDIPPQQADLDRSVRMDGVEAWKNEGLFLRR
jgi:upstream activation factor subunit UAF30